MTLAGGITQGANAFLLVVTIVATVLGVVGLLASAAVYFGGSWRKSEMEMLRASREDLTSLNGELTLTVANQKVELAAQAQRIEELTSLVTSRVPFERIATELEKAAKVSHDAHARIISAVDRIASRLDGRSG